MNRLMIIGLFVLVCSLGFGQRVPSKTQTSSEPTEYVSNFIVVDGKLIWQKVFGQSVSIKDYEKFLKLGGHLDNIEVSESDSLIIARWRKRRLDFNGFKTGLFDNEIPPALVTSDVVADVRIDIRQSKYRVMVYNIGMIGRYEGFELLGTHKDANDPLELYYYRPLSKKKNVSENFKSYIEPVFDKNFIDKFEYKSIKSDF